jgi:uncharacterized protein DUF4190
MKRCPTCNQQFTDEWLTFCTQDGTSLVDVTGSAPSIGEPPPTFAYPPIPPTVSRSEEPTLDLPDAYRPPPVPASAPQTIQPGWQPPPPPPGYVAGKQQSLAAASLVLGLVSITIGWCCWFGVLTAPISLVLGIISLVQIKNNPTQYSGKGMAIGGIVTGGLYLVFMALIILLYGVGLLAGGFNP